MSNTSSSELFQLIKKLSKSEKRHFKLFASRHIIGEENKYVKLFDAIEKQEEQDEKALEKLPFVVQLSQLKNRLQELILKSLSAYYSQSSIEKELQDKMHYIEILAEKGLYMQAKKILKKAKETAYKYEFIPPLLMLLKWEIKLIRAELYENKTERDIEKFYKEENRLIENYLIESKYDFFNSKVFSNLYKEGIVRQKDQLQKYKLPIVGTNSIKNPKSGDSFYARYYYYETLGGYYFFSKNFAKAYEATKKLLELLDQNMHQAVEKPFIYINTLSNLLECILQLKKYKEFDSTLDKLKQFKPPSIKIQTWNFYIISYNELIIYQKTKQPQEALPIVQRIEKELKQLPFQIHDFSFEFPLYYILSLTYFGNSNYKKALEWNNKILNNTNPGAVREDIYSFAKVFSLIIHFELKNQDLLEYTVVSTYRYLVKKQKLYKLEYAVLSFIRKGAQFKTAEKFKEALIKLKKEFMLLSKNPFENTAFIYFDYIAWLEDKIKDMER